MIPTWVAAAAAGADDWCGVVADLPDRSARTAWLATALATATGDDADALGAALQVVAVLPEPVGPEAMRRWLLAAACDVVPVRREAEASARAGASPPSCPTSPEDPTDADIAFETEVVGLTVEGLPDPERAAVEETWRIRAVSVRVLPGGYALVDGQGPLTPLAFALRVGDAAAVERIEAQRRGARTRVGWLAGVGGAGVCAAGAGLAWAAEGGGVGAVAVGGGGLLVAGLGTAGALDAVRRARRVERDAARFWAIDEATRRAAAFNEAERARLGL